MNKIKIKLINSNVIIKPIVLIFIILLFNNYLNLNGEKDMLLNKYIYIFFMVSFALVSCTNNDFKHLQKSDNIFNLTTENDLTKKSVVEKIDSFYNTGVEGTFVGQKNIGIYYKYFLQKSLENEKGAIVISSGRTEAAVKYKELIYDLYKNGYSIYIHDHRGQGLSDRMIPIHDMGFIDDFQNYVKDLKQFYNSIVLPNKHKNKFLLAHSMGGAIGMIYLEEYNNDFKAAAFSSPMLGLSFPTCLAIGFLTGDTPEYAMGHTDYDNGIETFAENTLTNSEIRYKRMLSVFEENPKARLGGASYEWVSKSCGAFDYIFDNYKKVKTPLIVFSGGEEMVVDPSAHNKFIDLLIENGNNAEGYLVENAKHELFIAQDNARTPVVTKALEFFNSVK